MGIAKVIAFTCSALSIVLIIAAISTSDWMLTDGWREGLFSQCIGPKGLTPVPFHQSRNGKSDPGCYKGRGTSYLRGVAALVLIGIITDSLGTFLTAFGLRSTDPNKKNIYYRVAVIAFIVAVVALIFAAIIYPAQFSKDLRKEEDFDGGSWDDFYDQDYDNDGIINSLDKDDDGDGIPDDSDADDDNDGILDEVDDDDDNDGVPDDEEGGDLDNDGILNEDDDDIDGDGLDNEDDPDDDNDGIPDDIDVDDDGDGILDVNEIGYVGDGDSDVDGESYDDDTYEDEDVEDEDEDVEDEEGNYREYSFGFGYGATCASIILMFTSIVLILCDRESGKISDKVKEKKVEQDEEEGGEM